MYVWCQWVSVIVTSAVASGLTASGATLFCILEDVKQCRAKSIGVSNDSLLIPPAVVGRWQELSPARRSPADPSRACVLKCREMARKQPSARCGRFTSQQH